MPVQPRFRRVPLGNAGSGDEEEADGKEVLLPLAGPLLAPSVLPQRAPPCTLAPTSLTAENAGLPIAAGYAHMLLMR
jgi:hypothetical protein